MWKFIERYNNETIISLHDCKATRIYINSKALFFEYENGFWCLPTNKNNPYNEGFRTDLSLLKVSDFEIENIYLFNEIRLLGHLMSTQRKNISVKILIENINSGRWQLDFLNEYHTYRGILFHCWIRMNKKPYHKECQMTLSCDAMEYLWNNICTDKPW